MAKLIVEVDDNIKTQLKTKCAKQNKTIKTVLNKLITKYLRS